MSPESTHTLTTWFEFNYFRPFSTAVGTSLKKEVTVKMFTGSVILKSCVTSDLKAKYTLYLTSINC